MSSTPAHRSSSALKITEIFRSIQGESDSAGWPSVFVRLTGCPLRCSWCDTAYAFHGGEWLELADIVARVAELGTSHVCVTGGEPLAQKRCPDLLRALCERGLRVSLETSGALPVDGVDPRVIKVLDLKAPASGESGRNRWANLGHLQPHDQIKFVIADRADFDWARTAIETHDLTRWDVLLSPVWETLPPGQLADWLLESRLEARLQLQMHKVLWGDQPGR
jgi:7-carboxy-7-deazaguanine synthase